MKPARKQRLILIVVLLGGIGTASAFVLYAFRQNLMFFFTPTDIALGKAPANTLFRLGGMVVRGSVHKAADSIRVQFDLTDNASQTTVMYEGILPDLFREGQGIVAKGRLNAQGQFIAEEVLAKHDENYMPPQVKNALQKGMAEKMKALNSK